MHRLFLLSALAIVAVPALAEDITLKGHADKVMGLTFAPDGKTLASGSWDCTVRFWDVRTGKETVSLRQGDQSLFVLFSPDGKTLASGSFGNKLRFWDVATGRVRVIPTEHDDWFNAASFTPDGKTLAVGSYDGTITLWDVASGKLKMTLRGHSRGVLAISFSPDGSSVASGSNDRSIRIWDAATGKEKLTLDGHKGPVIAVSFSADGKSLSSAGEDMAIKTWKLKLPRDPRTVRCDGSGMRSAAFSPDGRVLASASAEEDVVRVWEVLTGKERRHYPAEGTGRFFSLAFSPDGTHLAFEGKSRTIGLWRMTSTQADGGREAAKNQDKDTAALWDDMKGSDASRAYEAMCRFINSPAKAVEYLGERVRPVPQVDGKRLARLVKDLDDDDFDVREKASQGLAKYADVAEPALEAVMQDSSSAEARQRAGELLARIGKDPTGDALRALRVVEVLEHIGTPEACQLLRSVADGAPEARLTRDARASLDRLGRRAAPKK